MGHEYLREVCLQFKATAAVFGCIPAIEPLAGLNSTAVTEFNGSTMESVMFSAGDLHQDTDHSDTQT